MPGLLLRDGRPWKAGGPADLLIRDGVIADVGAGLDAGDAEVVDLGGRLVLPGLVEAHCHLDKTLYGGPWRPHSAGPAPADRIADERLRRTELGLPDPAHVTALLETMAAAGTTHVRTHTDVYSGTGLTGVEVVRDAAARLAEAGITITTAAIFDFPVPPVKKLRAAGVNVACGHDDIRDLWSPYGSGDLVERAMHLAYRSTFRRDEDIEAALEAVTYGGRAPSASSLTDWSRARRPISWWSPRTPRPTRS